MNNSNSRNVVSAFFVGAILSMAFQPAQAAPSQIPLNVGISAAKPNIMLMIDSSGSMNQLVTPVITPGKTPADMPSDTSFICNNKISGGITNAYMSVNNSGIAKFCKSGTNCQGGSNQQGVSTNNVSGGNTTCFINEKTYTVYLYNTSNKIGPYTGLQLNWYFNNVTLSPGKLTAAATVTGDSRSIIAKRAATELVESLTPAPGERVGMRMGLSCYNGDAGGKLLAEIKDLDSTQASNLTTLIDTIPANGSTPLAETLSDIGKYFATSIPSEPSSTAKLTPHPYLASPTPVVVDTLFSKADGTPRAIKNETCGSATCSNVLAAPILGYCQKSFVILISDGLPNSDRDVSSGLRDYTGDCATKNLCDSTSNNTSLPGIPAPPAVPFLLTATGTACNNAGNWGNKACKNGTKAGRAYETGGSDYLDDVAQALYEMDLRPTLNAAEKAKTGDKNNLVTYAVGFADPNLQQDSVLKDAATVGKGKFFYAEDAKALSSKLDEAITDIAGKISSSASVVANSAKLDLNSAIFQGKFDSADWSGSFAMFALSASEDSNGNGKLDPGEDLNNNTKLDGGAQIEPPVWQAAEGIPAFDAATSRNILTYNPTATQKGVDFACDNLAPDQKTALGITNCTDSADTGVWRLNYIRGDSSHEVQKITTTNADDLRAGTPGLRIFRNRAHYNKKTGFKVSPDPWLLGDIVNSSPVYVADDNYRYDKLSAADGGTLYKKFVSDNAARRKMVYVGANDGMLHGFDASASTNSGGDEIFAYIPDAVYDGLTPLSSPNYDHRYMVDGSPRVADAFIGGAWHTLLVSTTGAGGKAVFALDVTNPDSFGGGSVLWEISDSQSPNASDLTSDPTTTNPSALRGFANNLGYTLPQPSIVKMKDGSWAAIVANGYDSVNNLAVLYIINVQTGNLIAAIDTKAGSTTEPNGLSTPITVDTDGDKIVDVIYAGDLLGNLWEFDVSSTTPNAWGVANGGNPLFVACSNPSACNTTRQPITGKPQISGVNKKIGQNGGVMVYFGTGKYYETVDNNVANAQTQTFYGIWDTNTTVAKIDLQAQTIDVEGAQGLYKLRATSKNPVTYPSKKGWYMNFLKPSATTSDGERVVSFPLFRGGRIIFNTLIPIPPLGVDICGAGSEGTSWLMELDAYTGSRLGKPPWDINGDGKIDEVDLFLVIATGGVPPSGKQSTVGVAGTPGVVTAGRLEYKYTSGSKEGDIEVITEQGNDGAGPGSRQSWRQLQ